MKKLFEGNYVIEVPNEEGAPSKKEFSLNKMELLKFGEVTLGTNEIDYERLWEID